jgi:hypothetical protein
VRMPALGVARNDAADLIAYLAAETSRLAEAQGPATPQHHNHHHHKH